MQDKRDILEINNLVVKLLTTDGIVKAVRGVNLQVKKGEILGVVGESGCGKSMMVKSIMRLHDETRVAYEGSIVFQDKDILKMKESELLKLRGNEISMIFQNPMTSLSPIMKVGEQITEILIEKNKESKEKAKQTVCELFKKIGITPAEERFNQYPFEMSGGLQQRVMIAMAMATNPDLLIADEPTTALDVTIQSQILHLMKQVQQTLGISIIFISHDLGVIAEICDRVAVMYAGRIIESGPIVDIFDHPGHPYTKALLESRPRGDDLSRRLVTIPGAPPSLLDDFEGCSFAPRCPYCQPACREGTIRTAKHGDDHFAVCNFAEAIFKKGTP